MAKGINPNKANRPSAIEAAKVRLANKANRAFQNADLSDQPFSKEDDFAGEVTGKAAKQAQIKGLDSHKKDFLKQDIFPEE